MQRPYIAVVSLAAVALLAGGLGWRLILAQTARAVNSSPPPTVTFHALPSPSRSFSKAERMKFAFNAALNNDLKGLEKSLDSGLDINARNAAGLTLLMALAKHGDRLELIQFLMERGADAGQTDSKEWTALVWAAWSGDAPTLAYLLHKSNNTESSLNRSLQETIRRGKTEACSLLLEQKANPNAADSEGQPPLLLAAQSGSVEMVKRLLQHGAEINAINGNGETALLVAASRRKSDVLAELLSQNANVNLKGKDGETALMAVIRSEDEASLRFLLDKQADINERNEEGTSALILAAEQNREKAALILLEHNADVNSKNNEGTTPLMAAAGSGLNSLTQSLLDRKADFRERNNAGETALELALHNDHQETAALLKKAGAAE